MNHITAYFRGVLLTEGNQRVIRGHWAYSPILLGFTENSPLVNMAMPGADNIYLFEYVLSEPKEDGGDSGRYSGWFDLYKAPGKTFKSEDREFDICFTQRGDHYDISGTGTNNIGCYRAEGILRDGNIQLRRWYVPKLTGTDAGGSVSASAGTGTGADEEHAMACNGYSENGKACRKPNCKKLRETFAIQNLLKLSCSH